MAARNNGWCRHRTPFDKKDYPVCKIGIDYYEFIKPPTPEGWSPTNTAFGSMPCLGAKTERCPSYAAWTAEEIAAAEKETSERMARMLVIREAIIQKTGKNGTGGGQLDCPACKTGTVSWSRARNGHVYARCSTPDCASWME